jgi:hypothetical protein
VPGLFEQFKNKLPSDQNNTRAFEGDFDKEVVGEAFEKIGLVAQNFKHKLSKISL